MQQNSQEVLDYLDSVGDNDRGDAVKLNHTAQVLVELADFLITTARENLDKKGNTATGGTASSMQVGPAKTNATRVELDIEIASTYKFLNDGVKGTEGGRGKYSFKTKYPSKKMAEAISKWIKVRRVSTKYKAISKNERKNQKIKRLADKEGIAYAISTNIKKKGIDPTYFFSDAVKATQELQKDKYARAFKLDIIETLSN
jgi:hypothetical protein